jgi:hypothetical protein
MNKYIKSVIEIINKINTTRIYQRRPGIHIGISVEVIAQDFNFKRTEVLVTIIIHVISSLSFWFCMFLYNL